MLKDVVGLAEHQKKFASGHGYRLIVRKSIDDAVLNKAPGNDGARKKSLLSFCMCLIIRLLLLNKDY